MKFGRTNIKKLWRPEEGSNGGDNGQITIIGGSELFQGAPLMSLVAASRLVDTVFLATPESDKDIINKENLFSVLRSVIWVPREELDTYIQKSDAVLIGPGLMRYRKSVGDTGGDESKELTKKLLAKFPDKQWVIDGGSLQVMEAEWIPKNAIVTPNEEEFKLLFQDGYSVENVQKYAKRFSCIILGKNHSETTCVSDGETVFEVLGGNAGLTRGGVGDTLAGLVVGLAANNPPLLAAAAGTFLIKTAADRLFEQVGYGYNADDLGRKVFEVKKELIGY